MLRVLLLFWGILVVLSFPFRWLLKSLDQVSVLLSIFAVTVFFPPDMFLAQIIVVIAAFIISLIYLYFKKIHYRSHHITYSLNAASSIFILLIVFGFLKQASVLSPADIPQLTWKSKPAPFMPTMPDDLPDIYYIVLDGYGRSDILSDYYGYDNSEFLDYLSSEGFILPTKARSNYSRTVLSVSSTLNMEYISDLTPGLTNKDTYYWWLMRPLLVDSQVGRILKDIGYRSYSTTSGWGPTDNLATDIYYQPAPIILSDLEGVVLATTPLQMLYPFLKKYAYIPSYASHRDLILKNLEILPAASKDPGPKFFFAHLIAPHPPFVFDEKGTPITPDHPYSFNDGNDLGLDAEDYRNGYIAQLKFINTKLKEAISEVLKNSQTPPIIILQADHGPGMYMDFTSPENTCLRERYSIFAAYHLPGIQENAIPDDITPVNLFRIIFNEYFGADYPLLPNSHYFTENIRLFHNQDLTPQVDTCSIFEDS